MSKDKKEAALSSQLLGDLGVPIFIISTFFPKMTEWFAQHPKLVRFLCLPLALWFSYEYFSDKISTMWHKITSIFMSSVKISGEDTELYSSFQVFFATKKSILSQRSLSATSSQHIIHNSSRGSDPRVYQQDIIFAADSRLQFFSHEGRLFVITIDKVYKSGSAPGDITIRTFGWSPEPITKMLGEAHKANVKKEGDVLTHIFVPYNKSRSWTSRCSKPRRPLSSVYLPEQQKQAVLKDVGEYLDKKNKRWHEDRAIPLRRGYLFHGLPGTGKTTLAMAIAGHFKLNVFILSLLDSNLNDNTLLDLMRSVGPGTMLLLEDVDAAGLGRRAITSEDTQGDTEGNILKEEGSRVSLSGLLNALDGASAPEGHVLVLTTNCPDSLDAALVRPGRADVKIAFTNANSEQIRDIFLNMYMPIGEVEDDEESRSTLYPVGGHQGALEGQAEAEKQRKELEEMADAFAAKVPEGLFSPAELQGFIILHKDKPAAAVEAIEEWVESETE